MALDSPSWVELVGGGILSALGGGGGLKLFQAIFGRETRQVQALGATIESLSGQLSKADERQDAFGDRLDRAEDALDDCKAHHEVCRQELGEVNRRLDHANAEVKRMMDEIQPAGDYTEIARQKVKPGKPRGSR